jgi:hypothetical protein
VNGGDKTGANDAGAQVMESFHAPLVSTFGQRKVKRNVRGGTLAAR